VNDFYSNPFVFEISLISQGFGTSQKAPTKTEAFFLNFRLGPTSVQLERGSVSISVELQADGVNDMSALSEGAGRDINMSVLALGVYGGGGCNSSFATVVSRGVESPWSIQRGSASEKVHSSSPKKPSLLQNLEN
jgi:hypothetical protein